jgi:hypothetical protein
MLEAFVYVAESPEPSTERPNALFNFRAYVTILGCNPGVFCLSPTPLLGQFQKKHRRKQNREASRRIAITTR